LLLLPTRSLVGGNDLPVGHVVAVLDCSWVAFSPFWHFIFILKVEKRRSRPHCYSRHHNTIGALRRVITRGGERASEWDGIECMGIICGSSRVGVKARDVDGLPRNVYYPAARGCSPTPVTITTLQDDKVDDPLQNINVSIFMEILGF